MCSAPGSGLQSRRVQEVMGDWRRGAGSVRSEAKDDRRTGMHGPSHARWSGQARSRFTAVKGGSHRLTSRGARCVPPPRQHRMLSPWPTFPWSALPGVPVSGDHDRSSSLCLEKPGSSLGKMGLGNERMSNSHCNVWGPREACPGGGREGTRHLPRAIQPQGLSKISLVATAPYRATANVAASPASVPA